MLKWPDANAVGRAVRVWASGQAERRADILRIGYLGSYARGDWGVGSDLDIVVVLEDSVLPFNQRATTFDATALPVPVDLRVYTRREWDALTKAKTRFARAALREIVWVYTRT